MESVTRAQRRQSTVPVASSATMLDNRFETPKTNGVDRDRHHHTLNPDPTPRQPQPARDLPAFTARPQAAQ